MANCRFCDTFSRGTNMKRSRLYEPTIPPDSVVLNPRPAQSDPSLKLAGISEFQTAVSSGSTGRACNPIESGIAERVGAERSSVPLPQQTPRRAPSRALSSGAEPTITPRRRAGEARPALHCAELVAGATQAAIRTNRKGRNEPSC